ncbi:MAG: hypothetical protein JSV91_02000 [Phycisphaerales bacterium]|nr:MAG: hypothetical protein JSV91_02000 [Phycisphaerales bacterium]
MEELLDILSENFIFAMIALCFLAGIALKALTKVITNASRERSRREIAAYIAEGSITPEQGERLMRADINRGRNEA